MKALCIITCDKCGTTFVPGNRKSGVPNGLGFMSESGKLINVCADCIMSINTPEGEEWLEKIKADLV